MRIQTVQKARKDQGTCEACHRPILAGQGYRYISPRYGGKRKRHLDCPMWRPSEMTTSKLATALAAQEAAHDALDALEWDSYIVAEPGTTEPSLAGAAEAFVADITQVLADCAEGYNECAQEYQEGLDNMPDGLRDAAYETQEKIDTLENAASDLEGWQPSEPEVDDSLEEIEEGGTPEDLADMWRQWAEQVLDEARQAVDELGL